MLSLLRGSRLATGQLRSSVCASATLSTRQTFHSASALRLPQEAHKDRENLQPYSKENTRSGTDDDIATGHGDAAFNPDKTSPESEKEAAGVDSPGGNPLDVSGANQEMSKPMGDKSDSKSRGTGGEAKERTSGAGKPEKNG